VQLGGARDERLALMRALRSPRPVTRALRLGRSIGAEIVVFFVAAAMLGGLAVLGWLCW
jgi:hypothetical protein